MGAFVSFQTGTITIANGASAGTFTIPTNVIRENCILIVRRKGIDSTVTNSDARVIINPAGTLVTATRAGTTGAMTIDVDIYEDTGLTTQWLTITQSTASLDTAITAVTLARTIAIPTGFTRSSTSRGRDDYCTCNLTTTTNLQTVMDAAATFTVVVQIVQFDADLVTSVNRYSKAITTTTGTQTITSVDTSKSVVFPAGFNATTSIVNSTEFHSYGLDSSTTVGFESYATPGGTMTYAFYVVEFANVVVNPGVSGSLTTASASPTIVLSSAPTRGTLLLQGGANIQATDNLDDGYDRDSFGGTLSSATWTLSRVTADDSKLRYSAWDWATLRVAGSTSIPVIINQLRTQGIA